MNTIDVDSSDEQVILFLGERRVEDPIPSNVITEIHPFSIDPRNSSEHRWYMYTSKVSRSHGEESIIKVNNGYWKSINNIAILTKTPTVGRKITREFYLGDESSADKTNLRMHEYCTMLMVTQTDNKTEDTSALCRFFLQDDDVDSEIQCDTGGENIELMLPNLMSQQERNTSPKDSAIQVANDNGDKGDAGGENISLPTITNQPEKSSSSKDSANEFRATDENEERQQEVSNIQLEVSNNFVNDNSIEGLGAGYEDYMELNDLLYDPEDSFSFSSNNSSLISMNSDERFDAETMGFDIETMANIIENGDMDEMGHVDDRFNVATTVRSDQVVIQPPPYIDDLVASDTGCANSIPLPVEPESESDGSTSSSSQGGHASANHSGSSSSKRSKSRSSKRLAELGKRYCCFI